MGGGGATHAKDDCMCFTIVVAMPPRHWMDRPFNITMSTSGTNFVPCFKEQSASSDRKSHCLSLSSLAESTGMFGVLPFNKSALLLASGCEDFLASRESKIILVAFRLVIA